MANLKISGFDGIDKLFEDLSDFGEIAVEAVNEAAPILEKSMKSAIKTSAKKGYATGQLAASVIAEPAKKNQYGTYSVVHPKGKNKHGIPNSMVAAVLEYGRKGGYKSKRNNKMVTTQKPAPFRQKAINDATAKCEESMKETVYKKVDEML